MIKRATIFVLGLTMVCIVSAQTVTKQFEETRYNFKDLHMIDATVGWGVGGAHWEQTAKKYVSTIMKTINGGADWTGQSVVTDDDLWDVHFINANQGWAVGDSGAILHTTNGGNEWTVQNAGTTLNFKTVFFTDALNGWAVANEVVNVNPFGDADGWKGRVWHTSNGGSTWTEQTFPQGIGLVHKIYFQTDQQGWAVGVRNLSLYPFAQTVCAMYYTENGGQTWMKKYDPNIDFVFTDIMFTDSLSGWAVGFAGNSAENGGSIFKTTDGGTTWTRIQQAYTLWRVKFLDSQRGYAVGAMYGAAWGPPVLRTIDSGATWQMIRMKKNNDQGLYGLSVFDKNVLAIGDEGYIATSTDAWGEFGFPHGESLFTQKIISTLYQFEDIFFINEQKGWAVGSKKNGPDDWAQVILHTSDNGQTWREQYYFETGEGLGFAFRLNAVQFVDEKKGWAVGSNMNLYGSDPTTGILYTHDGGQTWTQQGQGVATDESMDVFFLDGQKGWILTNANGTVKLLKTSNAGANWQLVDTGITGLITIGYAIRTGKLFFTDAINGWILGAQSLLLRTTDGGVTWANVTLPVQWHNTYSLAFADINNAIICGETILRSENGGATWLQEEVGTHNFTDVVFTSAMNGWMVGEYGDLYQTKNAGIKWDKIEHAATDVALLAASFPSARYGWAAGKGGVVVKIDNSGESFVADYETKHPQEHMLQQNFPNPFNASTEIRYQISQPGRVSLKIYNLLGKEVTTLVDEYQEPGFYSARFSSQSLFCSSGVYYYQLRVGQVTETKKMIILN